MSLEPHTRLGFWGGAAFIYLFMALITKQAGMLITAYVFAFTFLGDGILNVFKDD